MWSELNILSSWTVTSFREWPLLEKIWSLYPGTKKLEKQNQFLFFRHKTSHGYRLQLSRVPGYSQVITFLHAICNIRHKKNLKWSQMCITLCSQCWWKTISRISASSFAHNTLNWSALFAYHFQLLLPCKWCICFRPAEIQITILTFTYACPSGSVILCIQKPAPFPAVVPQNAINKSWLACIKSERYASWVTLRPQWDRCRRGEAEVRILNFKTTWSEFTMPSQTAPAEVKPRCVYSILKPHGQSFITSQESVQSSCVR